LSREAEGGAKNEDPGGDFQGARRSQTAHGSRCG
jgi:hypothetical protein